jgi:hypothetical protein
LIAATVFRWFLGLFALYRASRCVGRVAAVARTLIPPVIVGAGCIGLVCAEIGFSSTLVYIGTCAVFTGQVTGTARTLIPTVIVGADHIGATRTHRSSTFVYIKLTGIAGPTVCTGTNNAVVVLCGLTTAAVQARCICARVRQHVFADLPHIRKHTLAIKFAAFCVN